MPKHFDGSHISHVLPLNGYIVTTFFFTQRSHIFLFLQTRKRKPKGSKGSSNADGCNTSSRSSNKNNGNYSTIIQDSNNGKCDTWQNTNPIDFQSSSVFKHWQNFVIWLQRCINQVRHKQCHLASIRQLYRPRTVHRRRVASTTRTYRQHIITIYRQCLIPYTLKIRHRLITKIVRHHRT